MTVVLRFILGEMLTGPFLLFGGLGLPLNIIIAVVVGVLSAVWGDRFLLGIMSLTRYLR